MGALTRQRTQKRLIAGLHSPGNVEPVDSIFSFGIQAAVKLISFQNGSSCLIPSCLCWIFSPSTPTNPSARFTILEEGPAGLDILASNLSKAPNAEMFMFSFSYSYRML